MAAFPFNPVRTAALAEAIAAELARAAYQLGRQGQTATAEALLHQARHNRIQALHMRAEAGAEQHGKMVRMPR